MSPAPNGAGAAADGAAAQGASPELITLNVGGTLFTTTRSTLTLNEDCMLSGMFRPGVTATKVTDAAGNPFIDRDPKHFGGVLAYLRDGRLVLPQDARERQELRIEARYYCLVELEEAIAAEDEARKDAQDLLEKGEEAEAYIAAQRAAVVKERVQALAAAEAALAAAQEAYASLKEQERAARQACNEAGQAFHQARADGRAEAELAQLQQAWQAAADRTNELVTQLRGAHLARRQARSAVEQADDQRLAALGMSWPHYTIEVGPQHAQQAAQQAHAHGPRPMAVPVAIPLPMPPPGPLPAWLRRAFPGQQGDEAWPGDAGPGPGLWQRAQDQPHALRAAEAARELWREQAERQRLQMQRQRAAEAAEEERMRRLHARVAHQPDRAREREVHGPRERERRHVRVAEQRAPQRAAEERGARREEQRGAWREEQQRAAEAAQRRRWEEQQALQERAAAAMQALMAQLAPPPVDEEVDQQVAGGGEDMQP